MKRLTLILLSVAVAALSARAETDKAKPDAAKAPAENAAKAKPADRPVVELKTKSVFDLPASTRNPFWPIGWKPVAKLSDSNQDHVGDISTTAFVVSSITIENNTKFAIVNGKIMQEGQQFGLQSGGQTFQVTLKRIEDGRVVIGRRDQELVVPLRRK
jgi:hypothetical protein